MVPLFFMTDTELPKNPLANALNDIIAKLMLDGADMAESYAIAMYPELGLPFIKQFFEMFLGWAEEWASIQEQKTIDALIFQVQKEDALSDVDDARLALKAAQKSGDQNAINQSIQNLRSAYDKALKSRGIGSVVSS